MNLEIKGELSMMEDRKIMWASLEDSNSLFE